MTIVLAGMTVALCRQQIRAVNRFGSHSEGGSRPFRLSDATVTGVQAVRARILDMECDECQHLSGLFLESMIFADKAEIALRAYFLTHQREASVSELAEYSSLKKEHQRTVNERDTAYMKLVNHRKVHGRIAAA